MPEIGESDPILRQLQQEIAKAMGEQFDRQVEADLKEASYGKGTNKVNGLMKMRTLIVAGTHAEAVQCAKQRGLKHSEWKYARPETLDGISNMKVVRFGSWRTHPRIADIERIIRGGKVAGVVDEYAGLDPLMYGDGKTP